MPFYEFKCNCGSTKIIELLMADRNTFQKCKKCGGKMTRQIPNISLGGMDEYGRSKNK